MKKGIFTVYDMKANAYGNPFFMVNDKVAMRAFEQAANDATTEIFKFPSDFNLTQLGWFDDFDGSFETFNQPQILAWASQFKGE